MIRVSSPDRHNFQAGMLGREGGREGGRVGTYLDV